MSSTAKIIIAVVVVLVIGGAIWHYSMQNGSWSQNAMHDESGDSTSLPSGSDTSDAALDQDMTSINANMQGADSDSANADQSVDAAASGSN